MNVWTSVQVKDPDHPRVGEAGIVYAIEADPQSVVVRFDLDMALESVRIAELQIL